MAYFRTIIRGTIGAGEVWTTSYTWGIFGLAPDVPDQAAVDAILNKLVTLVIPGGVPTSLKLLLSSQAAITGFRVEKRSEDERILNIAEGNMASAIPGTVGPTKTPQDAVVVSLRTSTPGARGRGRSYWPALGAVLSTSFDLTTPTPAASVADFKTWIKSIGDLVNAGLATLSDVRTVVFAVRSVTDHVCRNVTSIQVGSLLDTQRRRRDNLHETYSSLVYP